MLLAGLRRHHPFATAGESIAAQWAEFRAMDSIPHARGGPRYGVLCGADMERQAMEYMTAVEVAEFDPAAAQLGRMRVPPQHYAVFERTGPAAAVHQTWQAIWGELIPRSGYTSVHGPEFEVYGERFDARTVTGVVEIWAAVQPPAAR